MQTHIALLRAINVGGTAKLPMADLRALATGLGFASVRTYIQSGNLVFRSARPLEACLAALEAGVEARLGVRRRVIGRSLPALRDAVADAPFPDADPKRVLAHLMPTPPANPEQLEAWRVPGDEALVLVRDILFVHFPRGMSKSRLRIPWADEGTGRNMNSLRRVLALAKDVDAGHD